MGQIEPGLDTPIIHDLLLEQIPIDFLEQIPIDSIIMDSFGQINIYYCSFMIYIASSRFLLCGTRHSRSRCRIKQ